MEKIEEIIKRNLIEFREVKKEEIDFIKEVIVKVPYNVTVEKILSNENRSFEIYFEPNINRNLRISC